MTSEGQAYSQDELALYQANSCPAELLIPYNLSANYDKFLPLIFFKSKFKQSLFNMDSPLWMAMAIIAPLHLLMSFFLALLAGLGAVPLASSILPLALLPASLMLLSIPVYTTLVVGNLKMNGGRNWHNKILGPTHIGLTDSGFKLWWQGFAFYNYPNLALWSDIFYIDLKDDELTGGHCLHFIYQSGFGRRTIDLPLRGLTNVEDARLVLDYFAKNVLLDYQSDKFKEQATLCFSDCLKKIEANEISYLQRNSE